MRLVHWADLHLGYQRFSRRSPEGINQRELDVLKTFEEVAIKTGQLKPDLIVISGDMFDSPKPSNYTLKRTMQILSKLKDIRIVAIPGNHDRPKRLENVSPIELLSVFPNFHAVNTDTFLLFDDIRAIVVCCVTPENLETFARQIPDKPRYKKILLLHALLFSFEENPLKQRNSTELLSLIRSIDFDYVALGDLHTFCKVDERIYYPGSIEYVSTNFWEETKTPKQFICVDFTGYDVHIQQIKLLSPRSVVDLEPIDCSILSDKELLDVLEIKLTSQDFRQSIVRLSLINPDARQVALLSSSKVKKLRSEVFHLDLNIQRQPHHSGSQLDLVYLRQSIHEELAAFLNERKVPESTRVKLMEEFENFVKTPQQSVSEIG